MTRTAIAVIAGILASGCKAGDAMVRPDSLRANIW
jgi:hypothetical protein